MNYTCRKATIEDIEELSNLFDNYRMFYNKSSDIEAAKSFLFARLNKNEADIFVAADNVENKLLGFTLLYPLFSSTRMKPLYLLNDLFVSSNHRGKGISKLLLETAKEFAAKNNACSVMLETGKENIIGNNLYPSVGFNLYDKVNFYEWENNHF